MPAEREDPRVEQGKQLGRWIGLMLAFEAVGFALAFALGNLVHAAWMRASGATLEDDMPLVLTLGLSLVVGGTEGACLGTGQWLVLRRRFERLRWSAWAGATALGGGLAWALGMGLGGRLTTMPPPWLFGVLMIGSGLIFGGLLGGCQWLALRRHAARSGAWIGANALGWTIGLLAAYLASAVIDEPTPVWQSVAIGLAAGATMALVPAVLTGRVLRGLSPANGLSSKIRA